MAFEDHKNKKKIQCWVDRDLWDKLEAIGYTSPTTAVLSAFNKLLEDPAEIPLRSQHISDRSHEIPELKARIEGLQLLIEEKDKRIEDLRRETETLSVFAHYFKSLEYRRLEASTEERNIVVTHEPEEKPIVSPVEAHIVQEERETVIPEPEEKLGKVHIGKEDESLIKKLCKNCNQPFETSNPRKETCSSKCRSAYSRRKTVN